MKPLDTGLLDRLSAQARQSPRLRQNFNFHESFDEPCQRMLNAVEPGSYIRPHRHAEPAKPEAFIGVRGRLALVLFTDDGRVERILRFGPGESVLGVDLPPGPWHTVLSLESGSVFYETKPGPYTPIGGADCAPWAPPEGSIGAEKYLSELVAAARIDGKD